MSVLQPVNYITVNLPFFEMLHSTIIHSLISILNVKFYNMCDSCTLLHAISLEHTHGTMLTHNSRGFEQQVNGVRRKGCYCSQKKPATQYVKKNKKHKPLSLLQNVNCITCNTHTQHLKLIMRRRHS